MIYLIFDLDDTIIIHPPNPDEMYNIYSDKCLINLFESLKYKSYIFTNGTNDHADIVLDKMKLLNFNKVYARDTIPYMKPDIRSFLFVEKNILYSDYNKDETNTFVFFDDLLDNLNTAKKKGWITIWIHPRFNTKKLYNFIDYSYPNIYDALNKIKDIKFY